MPDNQNDGIVAGYTNTINTQSAAVQTVDGPLLLANQSAVPSTPSGGPVLYSIGGVLTYVNTQGLLQTIVGSQGGLTAVPAAITGVTTEQVLQSMSLPALDGIASAVYKMAAWGVFTSAASPGNTVFTMRLGGVAGTSILASANIALAASLTNAYFNYEARLNFVTPTTVTADVELTINTAVGGAASAYLVATAAPVTVSLSTLKAWVLDITPGASGNSIQQTGGWTERVC